MSKDESITPEQLTEWLEVESKATPGEWTECPPRWKGDTEAALSAYEQELFPRSTIKAQQTVDNAHMRYFIVHLHRLLDPGAGARVSTV